MKILKLFVLVCCCFSGVNLFAQTPNAIENDLLKSFKKIDAASQDNAVANDEFGKKLYDYTSKYPATIAYPFNLLKKEQLDINTSDDGLFRIYSWDTEGGGTMHFFESVFQFRSGTKTIAVLDTPKGDGDNRPNYTKLYTFKTNNITYYLAVYLTIGSTKDAGQGIQVFTIEPGKLIPDAKIIKTGSGLHSRLYYDYDFRSVVNIPYGSRPSIYFDAATQSIHIPLVEAGGKVTLRYIIYKFTGKDFEKVKQ
jgi:hypothetical protein